MKRKTLKLLILSKYDTLGDFADALGMDRTTLSSHLRGDRQMRSQTIIKFAKLLDIKQDEIGKYFFPEMETADDTERNV